MATKCVTCTANTARKEFEKNPNEQTAFILKSLEKREMTALTKFRNDNLRFCAYHHPNGTALAREPLAIAGLEARRQRKLKRQKERAACAL